MPMPWMPRSDNGSPANILWLAKPSPWTANPYAALMMLAKPFPTCSAPSCTRKRWCSGNWKWRKKPTRFPNSGSCSTRSRCKELWSPPMPLHTQTETARYLVENKGADYLFIVKDNQPTLRQEIADLKLESFPPSAHHHG